MTVDFKKYIMSMQDLPSKGIVFRDITPISSDGKVFRAVTHELIEYAKKRGVDVIVGLEARGLTVGCPVTTELGTGFVPARKPHKLPREVGGTLYDLEYGSNSLETHKDAIKSGQKTVTRDDLMTTAGTLHVAIELIERFDGEVVGAVFYVESPGLKGRKKLPNIDIFSLVQYHGT